MLRACSVLADNYGHGRMTTDTIATHSRVPRRFLSNILGQLRAAGIVTAKRGHAGGYELARAPEAITVAEVLVAVESEPPFSASPQVRRSSLPFLDSLLQDLNSRACEM